MFTLVKLEQAFGFGKDSFMSFIQHIDNLPVKKYFGYTRNLRSGGCSELK